MIENNGHKNCQTDECFNNFIFIKFAHMACWALAGRSYLLTSFQDDGKPIEIHRLCEPEGRSNLAFRTQQQDCHVASLLAKTP